MSRYIDADAVKNIIRSGVSTDTEADQEYVCGRIDEAPSIDIVRCKECIFDTDYYFKNDVKEHRYEWCYEFCDVDGYCPFGKKQTEREGE